MRYTLCVVVGMALAIAGVALIAGGAYEVARVGTCATGGAFQIARECPDGMAFDMFTLFGGTVATLLGTAVFAARGTGAVTGRRAGGTGSAMVAGRRAGGFSSAVWGMVFLGVAFAIWTSGRGDGALDGVTGVTGVFTVLPIMFAVMGGGALLIALFVAFSGRPSPIVTTGRGPGRLNVSMSMRRTVRDVSPDQERFGPDDTDRGA